MSKIVVIAPHPDDETLGCGGTLLRMRAEGHSISWVIATDMPVALYGEQRVRARQDEIKKVTEKYRFDSVHPLGYPAAQLDKAPLGDLIQGFSSVIQNLKPEILYVPFGSDVHSDHRIVFDAVTACGKWFRYPSVRKILAYETLSETDFALRPDIAPFRPNVYTDISSWLDAKIEIMKIYVGEMGEFPFPRSETAMRAQAMLRGAQSGYRAAEAFSLIRERV
jgi:LmbE family N-acetylglucosaminyl deacetylase